MITILKRIAIVGLVILTITTMFLAVTASPQKEEEPTGEDNKEPSTVEIEVLVVKAPQSPKVKELSKTPEVKVEPELPYWASYIGDTNVAWHYVEMQNRYSLNDYDMEQIMKIFWNESRFRIDISDNYNTNGSIDTGPMQINSCNWGWLSEMGLDVHNWRDNVEAGVYMYADLRSRYSIEKTIASYQCGEFSGYSSTAYSRKVVSMDLPTFIEAVK